MAKDTPVEQKEATESGSEADPIDPNKTYTSLPEPEDAAAVPPEATSPTEAGGTPQWECLTCGKTYDQDLGNCPDDQAPLRKIGPYSDPTGPRSDTPIKGNTEMKTPVDGWNVDGKRKKGSSGDEPGPGLSGEATGGGGGTGAT